MGATIMPAMAPVTFIVSFGNVVGDYLAGLEDQVVERLVEAQPVDWEEETVIFML